MPDLSTLPHGLAPLVEPFADSVRGLLEALRDGRLTSAAWQEEMQRLIARYHTAAFLAGGGMDRLTPELARLVEETVEVQLAFLDNWRRVIEAAGEFQEAWFARGDQYATAARTAYHEGLVVRQAGRPLPLPAMPAQGTICGPNCRCQWRLVLLDDEAENVDAYWERHADDSCQTCVQREREWRPVRIRDGVLQLG